MARINNIREYNSWAAQIVRDRHAIYLGSFETLENAINARKEAEKVYF